MVSFLAVVQVLLVFVLVGLVLMHSGRDAGMGGMGFTPASQGGTHIVERNLTRYTLVVAVLFVANSVVLFHYLKSPVGPAPPLPHVATMPRSRAGGGIGRRARLRA
jgi:preprotein translocase subunit SecG